MFPFQACSTISITGATGSGKSSWVFKLLKAKDVMFTEPPVSILYCYGVYQPLFDDMEKNLPQITFHEGLPSRTTIEDFTDGNHNIVLLDDLMTQVVSNRDIENLFVMGSHHRRLTVIYLSQNVFAQGRCARTIAINTHYLILFRNMRSGSQITQLGRELYPGRGDVLVQAYHDAACNRQYGYLVVDMSPHSVNDQYRLRTRVFPDEGDTWVYVPRR